MTSPAYPSPAGDTATTPHPWDEVFVLREYELRDGVDLEQTSRFRDEVWSLGPGIHQTHNQRSRVHFASFPHRYRVLAKELLCAYMAMPVPADGRRLKLPSIDSEVVELRRFLTWLDDQPDAPELATLTGADLRAYSRHVGAALREAPSAGRARSAVRRIWRHRNALPGDRLLLDPH